MFFSRCQLCRRSSNLSYWCCYDQESQKSGSEIIFRNSSAVLWLTIPSGDVSYIQIYATYFYLLMALVIWPFMLPYSVYKMEFDLRRKKLINRFFTGGVILSIYYAFCLVKFHVNPSISGFHVEYINDFPVKAGYLAFAIYLISTIAPLFLSTVKKMNLFGILITISCFVTGIFYKEFLTSVWCFFAALISAVIYFIIKESDSSGLILG